MGQTVVLDSGNLDAIVADATGEPLNEKPAEVIEEPKVEAKVAPEDDTEGEDGLTPREKRELTAKMQKAIAKRTVALRDAEEFAAEQLATRKTLEAEKLKIEAELAELKSRNVPRETSATLLSVFGAFLASPLTLSTYPASCVQSFRTSPRLASGKSPISRCISRMVSITSFAAMS